MCGIAGIYERNGRCVSLETVETMGRAMFHRGPDNFSSLGFTNNVGLAHNRLSFLDLSSAANQPFKNENQALVYNGEIYNFKQIRERLGREHDIRFNTTSDTEVLFYSLIYDGIENCLKQLRGMFAFAFFDKVKGELLLGRDRYGIKPLYYVVKDKTFFWSSEIKPLAKALGLKPDPLKTLFSLNGIAERSNEYTLFNDIRPIKPGTFLKVTSTDEQPREIYYYKMVDDFDPELYRDLDRQPTSAVLTEFDRLMAQSVERMLVSDVPVGTLVSGGIDSSLISAYAGKSHPDLKLFTANVLGKFSEYEDAKMLAKCLGMELYDYKFSPVMMLADWADVTYFYECPIIIHTNAIPFSNVARLARTTGVKAVLTGEGSDELFLGYPRLLTKRYDRIALLPMTLVKLMYKLVPGLEDYLIPEQKQTPLTFANQLIQLFGELRRELEYSSKLEFLSETKRREQLLTFKMFGDHLVGLLHRSDRMGMMASIEARFPFLDEDLVKFALNLPSKFKIGRSVRFHNYKHPFLIDKWIVRKAAEKYLPRKLYTKKKSGFPMHGHKFVKVKKEFFSKGWVVDSLRLDEKQQEFMLQTQDPYFVAKLASVEIFGRIYALGESLERVKSHVVSNAEMLP